MKRFRLDIARAVRDLLIHLPPNLKRKVKAALQALAENPYQASHKFILWENKFM